MPSDDLLYRNLFRQIETADALGFERAWIGEAHYSLLPEQKKEQPLLPHFKGELCINTDVLQVASVAMQRTNFIGIGSAIRNILVNGGPIAHAEMVRTFLTIHGPSLRKSGRKLHIGFGSGRFAYANEANGVRPRNAAERILWPALRGAILKEASEIFVRLLSGETLGSRDVPVKRLTRSACDAAQWTEACTALGKPADTETLEFAPFWEFEPLCILPTDVGMEHLELTLGSHDPALQVYLNQFLPVRVFNLSVTPGKVIDATHARMAKAFHPDGGSWTRNMMPRTIMVFVRADEGLSDAALNELGEREAKDAMRAYWLAMEGTVDEAKVLKGMENAVYGSPEQVTRMISERFDPSDRLMAWFDFNTNDARVVERRMLDFMQHVAPNLLLQSQDKMDASQTLVLS